MGIADKAVPALANRKHMAYTEGENLALLWLPTHETNQQVPPTIPVRGLEEKASGLASLKRPMLPSFFSRLRNHGLSPKLHKISMATSKTGTVDRASHL